MSKVSPCLRRNCSKNVCMRCENVTLFRREQLRNYVTCFAKKIHFYWQAFITKSFHSADWRKDVWKALPSSLLPCMVFKSEEGFPLASLLQCRWRGSSKRHVSKIWNKLVQNFQLSAKMLILLRRSWDWAENLKLSSEWAQDCIKRLSG